MLNTNNKLNNNIQSLHLAYDLFVIPDDENFLLYAPLTKSVVRVNAQVVELLRDLKAGHISTDDISNDILHMLYEMEILVDDANRARCIEFPSRQGAFDPGGLGLFLTTRCSMACVYCYADGGVSNKTMTFETAKTAIDWIITHTLEQQREEFFLIFHGGGEISNAKSLFKRCVLYAREQASKNNLRIRIESGLNGVMSREFLDWVIEHIDSGTVSLDGLPEIHNRNRPLISGQNSFQHVHQSLLRMDELNFPYGIRVTVTADSLHRLPESTEFMCKNYKTNHIQLEPVFQAGRAQCGTVKHIDPEEFIQQFRKSNEVAKQYNRTLKYSGARLNGLSNHFCKVSNDSLSVTSDGLLTSCFEVAETTDKRSELFLYGKVDEKNNRIDIDQDKVSKLRTLTVEHKLQCKNCFCKWHCAGDCSAKQSLLGDAWDFSNNPRCQINRALTKDLLVDYLDSQGEDINNDTR